MTETATDPRPQHGDLTLEDLALLADGAGNVPDATARRLQALIQCSDLEHVGETWRGFVVRIRRLRQMAADAGTRFLADGLDAFRSLERLRSDLWVRPEDVLDPRLEVPYRELIAMARARAERARGDEKGELLDLADRLASAREGERQPLPGPPDATAISRA